MSEWRDHNRRLLVLIWVLLVLLLATIGVYSRRRAEPRAARGPVRAVAASVALLPGKDPQLRKMGIQDSHGDPLPPGALLRLGTVRWRHGGAVRSLLFSPDGSMVMSGGVDGTVSAWDVPSGRERFHMPQWAGVESLVPTPDGKGFVSTDARDAIHLFRTWTDGRPFLRVVARHSERSPCAHPLAFSRDGNMMASADSGGGAALWDGQGTRQRRHMAGDGDEPALLRFSDDGRQLVGITLTGACQVWDVTTGERTSTGVLENVSGRLEQLTAAPVGDRVAGILPKGVLLWDAESGRLQTNFSTRPLPARLAFASDGKRVIGAGSHAGIVIWDLADGVETRLGTATNGAALQCLAVSPDGLALATGDDEGVIRLWNLADGKRLNPESSGHEAKVLSLAFVPDSRFLLTGGADRRVCLWDVATGEQKKKRVLEWEPSAVSAPDKRHGLAVGRPGFLLWSLGSDEVLQDQRFSRDPNIPWTPAIAVAPDGGQVAVAGPEDINLWNVRGGRRVASISRQLERLSGLTFSADGSSLAATTEKREIVSWEIGSRSERFRMPIPSRLSYRSRIRFVPGGGWILTGGSYETRIMNAPTGERIDLPWCVGHLEMPSPVSPDRTWLAGLDWTESSQFHVTPTGEGPPETRGMGRQRISGHRGRVVSAAFSPGGRYLATGGSDSTILVWDLQNIPAPPPVSAAVIPPETKRRPPRVYLGFEDGFSASGLLPTRHAAGLLDFEFATGVVGRAVLIGEERRPVEYPDGDDVNLPGAYTVQFWCRVEPAPAWLKGSYVRVIDTELFGFDARDDGRLHLFYRFPNHGGHGSVSLIPADAPSSPGVWHHVAMVYEGNGGKLNVYHDGKAIFSQSCGWLANRLGRLAFGSWRQGSESSNRVALDELMIYDYARTAEEVAAAAMPAESPGQPN